ncbi:MAG TPA: hypothetical protein VHL31_26160 [Geminicoccus sp.]|jgi:hypothetical protein|uniref:hypothetical protein n=1 Tax=Geminicoccus sp. TaxID=2024832 RepID=UPI002E318D1F|nr:hypothetical protein [Geminicoccus sp.]HEX2529761.1 hypothetical protein [Geminicoccus sp.]
MARSSVIVATLAVLCAPPALAAEMPDLVGTWTGVGPAVSVSDGWQTDRPATLVITEQQGAVFKGQYMWPNDEEPTVGVIRQDGKTILTSGTLGSNLHMLTGPDEMEACYIEGGDDAIAVCRILKRTK